MRIAVIGAQARIAGYALAGAVLCPAEDGVAVRAAWRDLPSDVGIVILTADAAREVPTAPGGPMRTVMPS